MSTSTKLAEDVLILLDRGLKLDYVQRHLCSTTLDNLMARLKKSDNLDIIKSVVIADITNWRNAMQQVNKTRGSNDFNEDALAELIAIRAPLLLVSATLDAMQIDANNQNNSHKQ